MPNLEKKDNTYYLPLVIRPDGILSPAETARLHGDSLALVSDLRDFIHNNYVKLEGIVDIEGRLYKIEVFQPRDARNYWYTIVDEYGVPIANEDRTVAPTGKELKQLQTGIRQAEYSEALAPQESVSIYDSFIEPDFEEVDSDGSAGHRLTWSALTQVPRVVVIGTPGAGKTTALRRLALHHFEQWEIDTGRPFPVYVQMRHVQDGEALEKSLHHYLIDAGESEGEESQLPSLRSMRIVLILDGLDEISETTRDAAVQAISRLVIENKVISIIASTRESGYFWQFPSFRYVRLLPLTQSKIREWSFYRLGGSSGWLNFITSLEERPTLQELTGNPLLLSIAVSQYRRNSALPQNRASLFKSYFDALADQWDLIRGVVRQSESWAAPARKVAALCRAAYFARAAGRATFTEFEFSEWNRDLSESARLLEICERDTGVVIQAKEGMWYFVHRVFHDYFAAKYVTDHVGPSIEMFSPLLKSGDWIDVWSLACGLAPNADDLVSVVLQNKEVSIEKKLEALTACFEQDIVVSSRIERNCASFVVRQIEYMFFSKPVSARRSRVRRGAKWSIQVSGNDKSLQRARSLLDSLKRLRKSRMAELIVQLLDEKRERRSSLLMSEGGAGKSRLIAELLYSKEQVSLLPGSAPKEMNLLAIILDNELNKKSEGVTPGSRGRGDGRRARRRRKRIEGRNKPDA